MALLARYPHPDSPYSIDQAGSIFFVRHAWHGVLTECDCLAEARHQIADLEDEEAARAAQEAREIVEAEAGLIAAAHECGDFVATAIPRAA